MNLALDNGLKDINENNNIAFTNIILYICSVH